jgi:hypothetical protein
VNEPATEGHRIRPIMANVEGAQDVEDGEREFTPAPPTPKFGNSGREFTPAPPTPKFGNSGDGAQDREAEERDGELADECGDEEVEVESQEADDVGKEDAGVRVKMAPTQPSNTEREKHEVTHCPYRPWCPICVAGRGQKSGHKRQKRDGGELPRFAMDYGFLGDEGQPTASLLVMRELKTGMMLGMIVEKKGVGATWVEQRVANFINMFGHKKLLVRSDNEPSILALRKKIVELVDGQVIQEDSIKGESQTNGLAEVGVKILEGMVRTLKIAVESRIGEALASDSILLA